MKRAVICFTRVPRAGQAKTRLIPLLGEEGCAALQWAFLKDLAKVYRCVEADLFVAFTPDPAWEELKPVFPSAKGFFSQQGAELGARMDHAIRTVLGFGYEACILTGSDLPEMTAEHLMSGFSALKDADIALGATTDGGYYLVGMKHPSSAIFEQRSYGGATVYEDTLRMAGEAGLKVGTALSCSDVDTPEDLRAFYAACVKDSHAIRLLKKLKGSGIEL